MDSPSRKVYESPAKRNSWKKENLSIDIRKCQNSNENEVDLYYQIKEMNMFREFLKINETGNKEMSNSKSTNNLPSYSGNLNTESNVAPESSNYRYENTQISMDLTKGSFEESKRENRNKQRKEIQMEDNTTRDDSIFSCYCSTKQGLCSIY